MCVIFIKKNKPRIRGTEEEKVCCTSVRVNIIKKKIAEKECSESDKSIVSIKVHNITRPFRELTIEISVREYP